MSNIGKKIIITPGRRQGGKLLPGNATYDTLANRLICVKNNPPRAGSPKYGCKREIRHPSQLQCPIRRPYSNRDYELISSTLPRRLKKAPDPKVSTPIKLPTEPRATIKNSTHTSSVDTADGINVKTLCSILSFPIALSIYPSDNKEICDCSRGPKNLNKSPMKKSDDKTTSHRGKRGTPKKPPDIDDNPPKQFNIKTSKKQGQINISEILKGPSKSDGKPTRRGRKFMKQNTDSGPSSPNTKTNNGRKPPAYDLNGKRIVDNITTPSQTILRKKALTPVTVSKNQELTRKRTKDVTGLPQTVMPKPVVISSPPRNIRLSKKPVESTEIPIQIPEQQPSPVANDREQSGDDPPDPIDPGSKELIPPVADPDVNPARHAPPTPVESPIRDRVHDEETPTENESSDEDEHERRMARLSDEFLQAVRRNQRKKGLPDDEHPITKLRIRRYLRGSNNNPDLAAENYVDSQNSYLLNDSSDEELSRDRSRSRERCEVCTENSQGKEPIDLTTCNDDDHAVDNPDQSKVPTRERSRSRDRHESQNVEHQKPPKEPGSKADPNLSSNNDDDSFEIKSLNGMLDEEVEKIPDDQLQHVVDTSNVNTPRAPSSQIPTVPPHSSSIPADPILNAVPSQATDQTAQKPIPITQPQSVNTPMNQSPSTCQLPAKVTSTPTGSNQKQHNKSHVFPPPSNLFSRKQQKRKEKPISILSFNSMIVKVQKHLLINVVEPTFIKRLQDVDMHERDEQMKIVDAYFYDESNAKETEGKYNSARADINDPFLVIPLINQEGMALMIRSLRVDDEGSHYYSMVFNPAELDVHCLAESVSSLLAKGKTYYVSVLGPHDDETHVHCPTSSKEDSGYTILFLILIVALERATDTIDGEPVTYLSLTFTLKAIEEMRNYRPTGFGSSNLATHIRLWVKRVIENGEGVDDGLTNTLRKICQTAHDEITDNMSFENVTPKDKDRVQTDFGPGRVLLITSPDETCMVYDSDMQTFKANTMAEVGAPNYLANREVALMEAQRNETLDTTWLTTAQACIIMTCDFSDQNQITNIILDLSIPAFRQSAEEKKEFQSTALKFRIACFANNAMSKIDPSSDPNNYPEPKSRHTSLVYMDVIKESNSELVFINKFSIDPIRQRINHVLTKSSYIS